MNGGKLRTPSMTGIGIRGQVFEGQVSIRIVSECDRDYRVRWGALHAFAIVILLSSALSFLKSDLQPLLYHEKTRVFLCRPTRMKELEMVPSE